MKKSMVKTAVCAFALAGVCSLTACGETLNIGKEYVAATSQLDALMKLDKGEADVAVIDSVMAGYYTSTGDYAAKMQIVDNLVLAEESYGIAAKKGNKALMSKINEALIALRTTEYEDLLVEYNLKASAALTAETVDTYKDATDASWTELVNSGTLVIGYTEFAPIAYKDGDNWTGFDIELAKDTVNYLNTKYSVDIDVEFLLIDWNTKEAKLEAGTIDLGWNGMTITPERSAQMCVSVPYLYNKQVAVILKSDAAKFTNKDSMKNAIMTAEKGSAGESVINKK